MSRFKSPNETEDQLDQLLKEIPFSKNRLPKEFILYGIIKTEDSYFEVSKDVIDLFFKKSNELTEEDQEIIESFHDQFDDVEHEISFVINLRGIKKEIKRCLKEFVTDQITQCTNEFNQGK